MGDKRPPGIDLFVMTVRFVEYASIPNALYVAQCVVTVGAPGCGRFLGFVFSAHLLVVDARKNVDALTTERVLSEGVCFIDNLVASSREHHIERTARIVDLDRDQSWVGPVELEKAADHLVELGPGPFEWGLSSAGAGWPAGSVVGVGCGVNTGQSFS